LIIVEKSKSVNSLPVPNKLNLTGNGYNISSQVIVKLSISSPEAHPKRAKKRRRNPKQTNRQAQEREKNWSGLNI